LQIAYNSTLREEKIIINSASREEGFRKAISVLTNISKLKTKSVY